MDTIEMHDVQGFIVRGYKRVPVSRYVLLHVTDAALAKQFIGQISTMLTNAHQKPKDTCLNIAFTHTGLEALGMNNENLYNFSLEFSEGMVSDHRKRLLGDIDSSDPSNWRWGGKDTMPVHILLMVFAADADLLQKEYFRLENLFGVPGDNMFSPGLQIITTFDSHREEGNKEHFGFRDGLSQPIIAGTGRVGSPDDIVASGEFILGYKNEYGVFADSPLITAAQGNINLLPADAAGTGYKDLGKNGSYLVFRQIEQKVDVFWNFMNKATKNEDGSVNDKESVKLASKMIGRWPSGAPLLKFPDEDPGVLSDDNDFNYHALDKEGYNCPFGSHLRRSNPRDAFEDNSPKEALKLTKRHRILRRGRMYGNSLTATPMSHTPEGEVGILFICFNADISRQYEFISYTWANYPKFQQLYNDPDPIIGVTENPEDKIAGNTQTFTIQQKPISRCINNLERFIQVHGGAYFFMPSITAVRYLSTI